MKKFATILLIVASIFVLASCSPAAISTRLILASGDGEAVSETASALIADGAKAYVKNSSGSYEVITSKTLDYGTLTVVDTEITGSSQASWKFTYKGLPGKTGTDTLTVEIGVLNSDGASFKTKCATVTVNAAAVWSGEVSESVALSNKSATETKKLAAAGSTIYIDGTIAASTEVKDASGTKVGVLSAALSSDKKSVAFSFSDNLPENSDDAEAKAVKVEVKDGTTVVGTYQVTCKHVGTSITKGDVTLEVTNIYNSELATDTKYTSFSTLYIPNLDGLNCKAVIDGLTVIYGEKDIEENVLNYTFDGSQIIYSIPVVIDGDTYGYLAVVPLFIGSGSDATATGYVKVLLTALDNYLLPYNWVTEKLRVGVYTDIASTKTVAHDTDFEVLNLTCVFDYATALIENAEEDVEVIYEDNGYLVPRAIRNNPSWIIKAYEKGSSTPIAKYSDGAAKWTHVGDVGYLYEGDTDGYIHYTDKEDDWLKPDVGECFVEIWAVVEDSTGAYVKEELIGELKVIAKHSYDYAYDVAVYANIEESGSVKINNFKTAYIWALDSEGAYGWEDFTDYATIELSGGQDAALKLGDDKNSLELYVYYKDKANGVAYVMTEDWAGKTTLYTVSCYNTGSTKDPELPDFDKFSVVAYSTFTESAVKDLLEVPKAEAGVTCKYGYGFFTGEEVTKWVYAEKYDPSLTAEEVYDSIRDFSTASLVGTDGEEKGTIKVGNLTLPTTDPVADATCKVTIEKTATTSVGIAAEGKTALLVATYKTDATGKETIEGILYTFSGKVTY